MAPVLRLERRTVELKTGLVREETVYGLTDLTPAQASASDLPGCVVRGTAHRRETPRSYSRR